MISEEVTHSSTCSAFSAQAGELLYGSSSQTCVFFLLEYNGSWGAKAFEESNIPPPVKEHLAASASAIPFSKILLIKQTHRSPRQVLRFFVVVIHEIQPVLYAFDLNSYESLLPLDLLSIVKCSMDYQPFQRDEHIYLVCTNGKRDACCAKYGIALYRQLSQSVGAAAWQCSHIGGHRFAANMLCLPNGLLYGRVMPESFPRLIDANSQGKICLENLRGRTFHTEIEQAAEYHLRQITGNLALDTFRLQASQIIKPGFWQVTFSNHQEKIQYKLDIWVEQTNISVFESCSMDKQTSLIRYHLANFQEIPG